MKSPISFVNGDTTSVEHFCSGFGPRWHQEFGL